MDGEGGGDSVAPLSALVELSRRDASGELIAAREDFEAHVFLLGGKIAWATSSTAPNALTAYLIRTCKIEPALIQSVVEECRHSRKRFGETLLEWHVATHDQVRAALRAQIVEALGALGNMPGARAIFLPRRVDYSADLVFDLNELLGERGAQPDLRMLADRTLRAVADALPSAQWLQVLGPPGILATLAHAGGGTPPSFLPDLARLLFTHVADSICIRSIRGAILGQKVGDGTATLWCGLDARAKLGIASTILAASSSAPVRPEASPRPAADGWDTHPMPGLIASLAPLEHALGRTDELLAGFLFSSGVQRLASVERRIPGLSSLIPLARELEAVLALSLDSSLPPPATLAEAVLYERAALQLGQGPYWHFATVLPFPTPLTLWLVLDRSAPQGMGWALLTTMARQLQEHAA